MSAQLVLFDGPARGPGQRDARGRARVTVPRPATSSTGRPATAKPRTPLCAACRAREARYGFQPDSDDPAIERPRTLCFECFRAEITRRQEAAHARQFRLPLEQTLEALDRRRRRAQIAARRALNG